jgi:integrase
LCRQASGILDALTPNQHGIYFAHKDHPELPAVYSGPGFVLDRFIKAAGVEHFTARDLRRTWKTLAGRAGLSKDIRDQLQNHAKGDISSKHYDRYDYLTERRAAVAMWESYLTRILAGEFDEVKPVEVVQIADAKAA